MPASMIPVPERGDYTRVQLIEKLSGFSIDRCEEILSQDLGTVLEHPKAGILLNAQVQCIRAIFHTMTRVGLESNRLGLERERMLAELAEREFGLGGEKGEK